MIERMTYINIIAHINNLDKIINNYISQYDIHLENNNNFSDGEINKYAQYFYDASKFVSMIDKDIISYNMISTQEALTIIDEVNKVFYEKDETLKVLEENKQELLVVLNKFENYVDLELTISKLKYFNFIKYRFGKIPITNYKQLICFLYDLKESIFIESKRDEIYVYGVYFVPEVTQHKIDDIYASLNFKEVNLPFYFNNTIFKGSLKDTYIKLKNRLLTIEDKILIVQEEKLLTLGIKKNNIIDAYTKIKQLYYNNNIKKYVNKITNNYFVLSGWVTNKDINTLSKDTEKDPNVILIIGTTHKEVGITPPTKLNNNKYIKPFEFFVKIYGIPNYNEIDPTPFVAITYTILFGMMFGDLGQGAVISLLGIYLYKKRDMLIGKIMSIIGVSSMVFGLLYGSVFGFEDIIPALWIKPTENINQILYTTVAMGAILIISAMVLNITNLIKQKDMLKLFLGENGVIGIIFYSGLIGFIYSLVNRYASLALIIFLVFLLIPVLTIILKEPIKNKLEGKKELINTSVQMFLLESIIETFEIILTYFTNTLSFVRVGAFALSHAGMMGVVLLLSHNVNGSHNFLIILLGNILVIAMEGLVIGIQALRIQFYEMFSRYYKASGREFRPCRDYQNKNN